MLCSRSMDPFVRRLVERLHDPSRPLSRNRHFHTFATPEGRSALRISKRLESLRRDILAAHAEGCPPKVSRRRTESGEFRVELHLDRVKGRRVSLLAESELELLRALPGMGPALDAAEE